MANSVLGKYVLGLQPDDRMPHDWLRMVARVFGAYRKRPLEHSIVAYIDGLNLVVQNINFPEVTIEVTPGQTFIDDQFIGFEESSFITFDLSFLQNDLAEWYYIVLKYEWINMAPPRTPKLLLVEKNNIDEEQMLPLGYVIRRDQTVEIVDHKIPWYQILFDEMTGDPEVDEQGKLPYVVYINEEGSENQGITYEESRVGTMDIGWALDFHRSLGNNTDYDLRLWIDKNSTEENIFLNNQRLLTQTDEGNGGSVTNIYNYYESGSDNKSCLLLSIEDGSSTQGSFICHNYDDTSLTLKNISDLSNPNSVINELTLTGTRDRLLLNGHPVWHQGNFSPSGKFIFYHGEFPNPPATRPDSTPVENGDVYYDTDFKGYVFYRDGHWIPFGEHIVKKCSFTAQNNNTTSIPCQHKKDMPVFVWVGGILLSPGEYDSTSDSDNIYLTTPAQTGEVIQVLSYWNTNEIPMSLQNKSVSNEEIVFNSKFQKSERLIGEIIEYAGEQPPEGFVECNGQKLLIEDYPELFEIIGWSYGTKRKKYFQVPDIEANPFKKFIKAK